MLNDLPKYIIICLSLTIIIELLVSITLKVKSKKDIFNIILVNILTNPIVVTIPYNLYIIYHNYYYISLIILEILTIIIEGFIYQKYLEYKKLNPYLLSLILNLASYGFGLILERGFL